jgi:hypothetical protein
VRGRVLRPHVQNHRLGGAGRRFDRCGRHCFKSLKI